MYSRSDGRGAFVMETRLVSLHGFRNVNSNDDDTLSVAPAVPVTVTVYDVELAPDRLRSIVLIVKVRCDAVNSTALSVPSGKSTA